MNQQTPPGVTYLVISILGILAALCIGTMCACALLDIDIQESLMTALISLSGTLAGAIGTLLSNTRSNNPGASIQTETTTSTSSSQAIAAEDKTV